MKSSLLPKKRTSLSLSEAVTTAPSFLWLFIFFLIPTLIVVAISFRNADAFGGLAPGWSLQAYRILQTPALGTIILRTLRLSVLTSVICLGLGIPAAYAVARMSPRGQQRALLLLVVPFWSNFIIRIYAWKVLLHPEGFIKQSLVFLGLLSPEAPLLYTEGAILLVLVYTYLPFAILPLYSAAEKFDFSLLEAAQDLGATRSSAFVKIFLPGIKKGIINALLIVFIPALGSYIIPDLMGGTSSEMLGNLIAKSLLIERNMPRASALSSLLILVVLLPSLISLTRNRGLKRRLIP